MIPVHPGAYEVPREWTYVSFETFGVTERTIWRRELKDQEACVVVLGGTCTVRTAAGEWSLGQREDPFGGPPSAVHVGAGDEVAIEGTPLAFVGVGYARGDATTSARVLTGPRREVRGSGAMERTIHHILMEDQPASSLLVTEVVTPAGHWSSYPPHKHDTDDPPREAKLEEIYYFRFKDPRGFGLMRIYTPDRSLDESIAVCDRDLVLVPRGYHTFSAAPGYDAYYLNVMAGPRREWKITFDPDHERMRW